MGGSDQWGNITTGTELIRRKEGGKAYALTCPLITKADGSKFGKTEGGNIWLDKKRTSVYKFYQYWLNTSDEDAYRYIKIFTFLNQNEIEILLAEHQQAPHKRLLQNTIAETVTSLVHSEKALQKAKQASKILFGESTKNDLKVLHAETFLEVFEGVPQASIKSDRLKQGVDMIAALAAEVPFLKSNGEARRALKENAISINKQKVKEDYILTERDIIAGHYILLQRGKKSYFIVKLVS